MVSAEELFEIGKVINESYKNMVVSVAQAIGLQPVHIGLNQTEFCEFFEKICADETTSTAEHTTEKLFRDAFPKMNSTNENPMGR